MVLVEGQEASRGRWTILFGLMNCFSLCKGEDSNDEGKFSINEFPVKYGTEK